jgi:hypothetical protein
MQLEASEHEILIDVLRESLTNLRKGILASEDTEMKQSLRKKEQLLKTLLEKFDSHRTHDPAPNNGNQDPF